MSLVLFLSVTWLTLAAVVLRARTAVAAPMSGPGSEPNSVPPMLGLAGAFATKTVAPADGPSIGSRPESGAMARPARRGACPSGSTPAPRKR